MMPTRPVLSRHAISASPSSMRRNGAPSAFNSSDLQAGSQYSRISAPILVPGPTRVRSSLSLAVGMCVPSEQFAPVYGETGFGRNADAPTLPRRRAGGREELATLQQPFFAIVPGRARCERNRRRGDLARLQRISDRAVLRRDVAVLAFEQFRRLAQKRRNDIGDVVGKIVAAEQQEIGKIERLERRRLAGEAIRRHRRAAPGKIALDF